MTRRTKIVATIGPASDSPEALRDLMRAGMNVVRLNLSHGDIDEHLERLARVREAAAELGLPIGVLADLPGPKVRSGQFPEGGVELVAGAFLHLKPGDRPSDAGTIFVDYETLLTDVTVGDRIIVGDGAICLRIEATSESHVTAIVETGGRTQGRPGIHLPSERLSLTTPTDEDLDLARTMAAAGVEYLAVSFVRQAADVLQVRDVVGTSVGLVSKIETSASLENLAEILDVSDAIMVARGDLGIDCPLEDVPHLQKSIIRQCVEYGLPVITATQVMESMVTAPSPTRAEVSDIANAVFDGTDALMLSGETAIGHDPSLVVETMGKVAERAEAEASYRAWAARLGRIQRQKWDSLHDRVTAAITHAASEAAVDIDAAAILCCTGSGRTARAMARFRPEMELVALSPSQRTVNTLALSWGVGPLLVEASESTSDMVTAAVAKALEHGRVASGDNALVLAGSPDRDATTAANVMRVVTVR
ncbi:MAG: pyruvate kinase [Ilumatobacteraceae bacterium]|nr:pyruvate kinase [Ilumatobacteraceae bacterium]